MCKSYVGYYGEITIFKVFSCEFEDCSCCIVVVVASLSGFYSLFINMPETRSQANVLQESQVITSSVEVSEELKSFFESLIAPLATSLQLQSIVNSFEEKFMKCLAAQENRIIELESELAVQKNVTNTVLEKCDDVEQYTRRYSVRVHGIEPKKDENIMESLKLCYSKLDLPFHPDDIDRAHSVGRVRVDEASGRRSQGIIVKFRSWDAKLKLYQARPKFKGTRKPGFIIGLDLTKRRLELLKYARERIKNNCHNVEYVFSDVNCSLVVMFSDGISKHFNNKKALESLLTT